MNRLLAAAILTLAVPGGVVAQVILLDDFSGSGTTGILPSTTWTGVGNVVFSGTTITVGNTALNDNGWGIVSTTIGAHSMQFITIVAQRDADNLSPFLTIAFEDSGPDAAVFSISTSSFNLSSMTTVQVPISSWGNVNPAAITGWTIGGGTAGVVAFRMSFDHLSLSTTAIPEPATYAALAGLAVLGYARWRRLAARRG